MRMNFCGLRSTSGNQVLCTWTMMRWPGRKVGALRGGTSPGATTADKTSLSVSESLWSQLGVGDVLAFRDARGKPRELTIKEMLQEFIRHRVTVIRRRTQFLLARARKRKHTVEGLLLALADIDEIIRIIRTSRTQA